MTFFYLLWCDYGEKMQQINSKRHRQSPNIVHILQTLATHHHHWHTKRTTTETNKYFCDSFWHNFRSPFANDGSSSMKWRLQISVNGERERDKGKRRRTRRWQMHEWVALSSTSSEKKNETISHTKKKKRNKIKINSSLSFPSDAATFRVVSIGRLIVGHGWLAASPKSKVRERASERASEREREREREQQRQFVSENVFFQMENCKTQTHVCV